MKIKVDNLMEFLLMFDLVFLFTFSNTGIVLAGNDDTQPREVGVEWVNQYHGRLPDLTMCDDDALGFYDHLHSKGFVGYSCGDDNAWESHFEWAGVGGIDNMGFIDSMDYGYFSGHGSQDAIFFGTNHDGDGNFPFEVRNTLGIHESRWGDEDLEWIALSACRVLSENGIYERLGPVFGGLHGITGFHTAMFDTDDLGRFYAYYLTDTWGPYCIGQAWRLATINDPHQTANVQAAIYWAYWTYNHYNEYLVGYGVLYPDPYPGSHSFAYSRWQC